MSSYRDLLTAAPDGEEVTRLIKRFDDLQTEIDNLGTSRARSLAETNLHQAAMWIREAILADHESGTTVRKPAANQPPKTSARTSKR